MLSHAPWLLVSKCEYHNRTLYLDTCPSLSIVHERHLYGRRLVQKRAPLSQSLSLLFLVHPWTIRLFVASPTPRFALDSRPLAP